MIPEVSFISGRKRNNTPPSILDGLPSQITGAYIIAGAHMAKIGNALGGQLKGAQFWNTVRHIDDLAKQVYFQHDFMKKIRDESVEAQISPVAQRLFYQIPLTTEMVIYFMNKVVELYDSANKGTKGARKNKFKYFYLKIGSYINSRKHHVDSLESHSLIGKDMPTVVSYYNDTDKNRKNLKDRKPPHILNSNFDDVVFGFNDWLRYIICDDKNFKFNHSIF